MRNKLYQLNDKIKAALLPAWDLHDHYVPKHIVENIETRHHHECKVVLSFLNDQLTLVNERLISCNAIEDAGELKGYGSSIFELYKHQDVAGKRYIIDLFTPVSINPITKKLNPLQINQGLSMITTSCD